MQSAAAMNARSTVQGGTSVSLTSQGGAMDLDDDVTASNGALAVTDKEWWLEHIVTPSGAFSIWQFARCKDFWAVPSVRASVRPNPTAV